MRQVSIVSETQDKKRDSFVFYRSFYEAICELSDKEIADTLKALSEYALNGIEPNCSGIAKAIYIMAKPQLDANTKRYQNGTKGGRPNDSEEPSGNQTVTNRKPNNNQSITKQEPNRNQTQTKPEPNVNDNDNVNVNVNENDINNMSSGTSADRTPMYPYMAVIDYLNQKLGTNYQHTSKDTRRYIKARCDAGASLEDFKTVIDKKCAEWKGTEWEKFLRPKTLFGTNFESYLNQTGRTGSANPEKFNNFQGRDYNMSDMEKALLG